jgi:hypothetical protein
MTLATGIPTGSATDSATASSWGHRIIPVLQSSVALSVESVALPVEVLIFIFALFWEMRFIHIPETIGSATGSDNGSATNKANSSVALPVAVAVAVALIPSTYQKYFN